MHRHTRLLACDVPKRVLDAADRAPEVHRAAPPGEVVIRPLKKMLDVAWIAPDQIPPHLVYMRRHLNIPVRLGVSLAPAVDTLVRLDFDEAEVLASTRIGQKMFHICYLHHLLQC